jgi:hypothetical protein
MSETERFEKLLDLKVQEATYGLSQDEVDELKALLSEFPDWEGDESLSLSAASFQLAGLREETMPGHLVKSIEDEFSRLYQKSRGYKQETPESSERSGSIFDMKWLGWAFAGAFGVALLFNSFSQQQRFEGVVTQPAAVLTTQQQLEELLKDSGDVVRNSWESPAPDQSLGFEGEVVWSESKQKGFMRFKGLPINDKNKETYQLWIFDENQKSENPIDGGIFDADSEGELIVPIQAKLEVKNAQLFAVTIEKPGGVVVSEREKLIGLAKVKTKV